MNPVCGIVTTPPKIRSSNLLQWDAPECVSGCDVCHNTIQVSNGQWKYLAAMHPDQRLRSLALRLLDTAQTLAEQRAEPLRAIIESPEATPEERFEALAQLATLSQEIVRKLLIAEGTLSDFETVEPPPWARSPITEPLRRSLLGD